MWRNLSTHNLCPLQIHCFLHKKGTLFSASTSCVYAKWLFSLNDSALPSLSRSSWYYGFCWLLTVQRTFTRPLTIGVSLLCQTSQGKHTFFPSMSPLHLLCTPFDSKDLNLLCSLIQVYLALYEVRVPRSGGLPPTSFRFWVTPDTLVLS